MIKQQGFTLIEVMVALLIVAVALAALSQTLAMFVNQQASLPERTYAGWIAQNRLTELQHSVGEEVELKSNTSLGGQEWQTEISLEPTPIPGMMRATVEVRLQGSEHLANRMVTVVGN
ncbi:MAG: type II secretion system minor pseudopilin GspI [Thiomicrospira sp.]|uniref:type II secretion system minor pseudopilin GspI n=1 Tax=Thiomicrospira sp. TaxID=935 RepID=UPI001A04662B|nr:type II secretion system minor pseudopilin GspI [Thiomicrospira sp.]MBE0494038.1 type II secretion system minor pseudopilin GspI [Thiomicrospira sp.]